MPTIAIVEYCRLRYACAPSRTAAEISCILALPASAAITDCVAQIAKAIASAPHRTMILKAVIEYPRLLTRRTESRPAPWNSLDVGRPPASSRRGHCQKRPRHAMAQLPEHAR